MDNKLFFMYDFKCLKCGGCCRSGYIIYIDRLDIEKWNKLGGTKIIDHISINNKSISKLILENNSLLDEEKDNLGEITKDYDYLMEFIKKSHHIRNKNSLSISIESISDIVKFNLILIPKSFKLMMRSIDYGFTYIIMTDSLGKCPFLDMNLCSIHNYKPIGCIKFPYLKEQCLYEKNNSIIGKTKVKKVKI